MEIRSMRPPRRKRGRPVGGSRQHCRRIQFCRRQQTRWLLNSRGVARRVSNAFLHAQNVQRIGRRLLKARIKP
jgi:hypothetical protein